MPKMKKRILVLSNHPKYTYNFRGEILFALQEKGYKIIVSTPYSEAIKDFQDKGIEFIENSVDRHSVNIFKEIKLFLEFRSIIKKIKPDLVLSYTIKPNLYGGFWSRVYKIPYMPNITGLGTATGKKGFLQKVTNLMYKVSFKKVTKIFFQNNENLEYFKGLNFDESKFVLLPGSGVNIDKYRYLEYPPYNPIRFVYISRLMKEKGIDEYLEAATIIKEKHPNTEFHICGFHDGDYEAIVEEKNKKGIIKYHGLVDDVRTILKDMHCTIHPSYYPEGTSNALLESAATGRPIITTNNVGCKNVIDDNVTGYLTEIKNTEMLVEKIEKFISLDYDEKVEMGKRGREKVSRQNNRKIVVEAYSSNIDNLFLGK